MRLTSQGKVGIEIFSVLLYHLTHHSRQHFKHWEIAGIRSVIDMNITQYKTKRENQKNPQGGLQELKGRRSGKVFHCTWL